MKRTFIFVITLAVMCSPMFAEFSTDEVYVDKTSGLSFKLSESKATSGSYVAAIWSNAVSTEAPYSTFTEVVIPASVYIQTGKNTFEQIRVVGVARDAFSGNKTITKITSGENAILLIGIGAFSQCSALEEVDLSIKFAASLTDTQKQKLLDGFMKEIRVGTSSTYTTHLGGSAFLGCDKLETVKLPEYVTEIGASAFRNCFKLKNPNMGSLPNLTRFNDKCFGNCTSLENFFVGEKVTTMAANMFEGCKNLSYVEWTAKNVGDFAEGTSPFYALKDNDVPLEIDNQSEMTRVPAYFCYGMKNLEYTWALEEIGAHAYDGCVNTNISELWLTYTNKVEEGAYNGVPIQRVLLPTTPPYIADENVFGDAKNTAQFVIRDANCDANAAYKSDAHWKNFDVKVTGQWDKGYPKTEAIILDEYPTGAGTSRTTPGPYFLKYATCDDATIVAEMRAPNDVAKCWDTEHNETIIPFGYYQYKGEKYYDKKSTIELTDPDEILYIVFTAATVGVENVSNRTQKYQKIVRDGQILILRDGKTYNLLGAEL